jgi:hypothetical protein
VAERSQGARGIVHGLAGSEELAMDANGPTYYVCASCLGERHEDCAANYEIGICACLCRHAAEGSSRLHNGVLLEPQAVAWTPLSQRLDR